MGALDLSAKITRDSDLKCTACGQQTNEQQRRNAYMYNMKSNQNTLRKSGLYRTPKKQKNGLKNLNVIVLMNVHCPTIYLETGDTNQA